MKARAKMLLRHSGMDCRNPVATDDIHAVWIPAIHAGMTSEEDLIE